MTMSKIVPKNPFLWKLEFPHFVSWSGGWGKGGFQISFLGTKPQIKTINFRNFQVQVEAIDKLYFRKLSFKFQINISWGDFTDGIENVL